MQLKAEGSTAAPAVIRRALAPNPSARWHHAVRALVRPRRAARARPAAPGAGAVPTLGRDPTLGCSSGLGGSMHLEPRMDTEPKVAGAWAHCVGPHPQPLAFIRVQSVTHESFWISRPAEQGAWLVPPAGAGQVLVLVVVVVVGWALDGWRIMTPRSPSTRPGLPLAPVTATSGTMRTLRSPTICMSCMTV